MRFFKKSKGEEGRLFIGPPRRRMISHGLTKRRHFSGVVYGGEVGGAFSGASPSEDSAALGVPFSDTLPGVKELAAKEEERELEGRLRKLIDRFKR